VSPDLVAEFPLRSVHPGVKRDEQLTIHVMDDIIRRVDIDPSAVLSTSWSSGGYIAHYMANRCPERFTCLAPRQSNFSAAVLDPDQVRKYRDTKVGIFYTENDFKVCRTESQEAARWYSQNGFDVTFAVFKDLGHERRPGAAAAFFARTCGARAKTPPTELARMQVTEIPLEAIAGATASPKPTALTGSSGVSARPPDKASKRSRTDDRRVATRTTNNRSATGDRQWPSETRSIRPSDTAGAAPKPTGDDDDEYSPIKVRVSSTIGIAPLLISFSVIVPRELRRGAYYLWTDNGEPLSNAMNGQKYLTEPGQHELRVLMTTAGGKRYESSKIITVLQRVGGD